MEIDWTVLTYIVIGLFALTGFFRGWGKEAITTIFLVILLFFLQQPAIAQSFVAAINSIISIVWNILPGSIQEFLVQTFNFNIVGGVPQFDPGSSTTWIIILAIFLVFSILISRPSLRNYGRGGGYEVRPMGSILGGLIGGLNGLIIISLIREYLDGSKLPQATSSALAPGGTAAGTGAISVTNVPGFTIMDSYLPWVIILIGVVVFLAAMKNRVAYSRKEGFSKVGVKEPYGYKKY